MKWNETKRKPGVNVGERTQVTLDDQIYISSVQASRIEHVSSILSLYRPAYLGPLQLFFLYRVDRLFFFSHSFAGIFCS